MVVLSTAMEPSEGTCEISEILNVGTTEDGFIKESHPKIKPVATDVQGIFVCGTAHDPKDITDSIMQATAAASKFQNTTTVVLKSNRSLLKSTRKNALSAENVLRDANTNP